MKENCSKKKLPAIGAAQYRVGDAVIFKER